MKNQYLIIILILITGLINAQTGGRTKPNTHEQIINTWFESPRESHGDTITFRLTRHIHVPEVDDPKALFTIVIFRTAPDFTVENWRWCKKSKFIYGGKWSLMGGTTIKLDFGTASKCKCQMSILSLEKDKFKVLVSTVSN